MMDMQKNKKSGKTDGGASEKPRLYRHAKATEPAKAEEALPVSFRVTRGGKHRQYSINTGFGYFIPSLRKAENLTQVAELVESGILSKDIQPIIEYLELKVPEIARAAAVSPSTVSRWLPESSIGVPGSSQFFKIDEIIKKGVDVFGGPDEFKSWIKMPNMALGNVMPVSLLTSLIGIDFVDEALDALHYGNVM
jgi:putative toxin-antitoxin system antitoxin component (TIGR02293 family)